MFLLDYHLVYFEFKMYIVGTYTITPYFGRFMVSFLCIFLYCCLCVVQLRSKSLTLGFDIFPFHIGLGERLTYLQS